MLQSSSGRKWKKCETSLLFIAMHRGHVIGGQRSVRIAPPCLLITAVHEGSAMKQISYTVGRNPIRNPEIQQNPEIHSEIQKSNLKSRNPLWNPEIQSNDPPRISVYFKLITSLCLHGRARIMYNVNIRLNDGRLSFHPIPCGSRDRPAGRKVIAYRWTLALAY